MHYHLSQLDQFPGVAGCTCEVSAAASNLTANLIDSAVLETG
jgi:hypothetical protein